MSKNSLDCEDRFDRRIMLNDNLNAVLTSLAALTCSIRQRSFQRIAGIVERDEGGTLVLACANGNSSRRVIFVNSYGGMDGIGNDFFPEVAASSCLSDPFSEKRRHDWVVVASMPWQEVK